MLLMFSAKFYVHFVMVLLLIGITNISVARNLPIPMGLECFGAWPPWEMKIKWSRKVTFIHNYQETQWRIDTIEDAFAQAPIRMRISKKGAAKVFLFHRLSDGMCSVGVETEEGELPNEFLYRVDVIDLYSQELNTFHGCCWKQKLNNR